MRPERLTPPHPLPMDPNIPGSFLFNNSLGQFPSEMKAPVCPYTMQNSLYKLSPGLNSPLPPGTAHGISDILGRPIMGSSPAGTLLPGYPAVGGFGGVASSGAVYYSRDYGSAMGPEKGRSGLGGDGTGWGEPGYEWRGAGGRQQCSNSNIHLPEPPGRKKHTRPTFSGHQIFALEKTFEQTKYLAGPERARLAYSLGMTESQVKVWFQNRRTKWRKKSASEPSSTQASRGDLAGDASENEVEDEEYNKPLDPDSDDEKIRMLLRKHRRAFSVLRLGPHQLHDGTAKALYGCHKS